MPRSWIEAIIIIPSYIERLRLFGIIIRGSVGRDITSLDSRQFQTSELTWKSDFSCFAHLSCLLSLRTPVKVKIKPKWRRVEDGYDDTSLC